jgi:hypothetical protein
MARHDQRSGEKKRSDRHCDLNNAIEKQRMTRPFHNPCGGRRTNGHSPKEYAYYENLGVTRMSNN